MNQNVDVTASDIASSAADNSAVVEAVTANETLSCNAEALNSEKVENVLTLSEGISEWKTAYKNDEIGSFNANTYHTTLQVLNSRLLRYFDGNKLLCDITAADAEDFLDDVSFGLTYKKTKMTANGAYNIYKACYNVFSYFECAGLVEANVFDELPEEVIPKPDKSKTEGHVLTEEELKAMLDVMVNSAPTLSTVANISFVYLACLTGYSPKDLVTYRWSDIDDLEYEGILDEFACKLFHNYKEAQKAALEKFKLTNPYDIVFCIKDPEGSNEVEFPTVAYANNWLKECVLLPNGIHRTKVSILSDSWESLAPLLKSIQGSDYPILGNIIIDDLFKYAASTKGNNEQYKKAREARREQWLAKEKAEGKLTKTQLAILSYDKKNGKNRANRRPVSSKKQN